MVRMAIHQNHRICGALGAPAGTLYPVRATPGGVGGGGGISSFASLPRPQSQMPAQMQAQMPAHQSMLTRSLITGAL